MAAGKSWHRCLRCGNFIPVWSGSCPRCEREDRRGRTPYDGNPGPGPGNLAYPPRPRRRRTVPISAAPSVQTTPGWRTEGRPMLVAYNGLLLRIYRKRVRFSTHLLADIPDIRRLMHNSAWVTQYLQHLTHRLETHRWPGQPRDAMQKLLNHYVRHWDAKNNVGSIEPEELETVSSMLRYLRTKRGQRVFEALAQEAAIELSIGGA